MPEFTLVIESNAGEHLDVEVFNDFGKAKDHAENSDFGDVFKVYEDKPLLWNGDFIRGSKKLNNYIDWVRVPIG